MADAGKKLTKARRCRKCGAVEQEYERTEHEFRWAKEGPATDLLKAGWVGPIFPNAELQTYERTYRERYFDCKFVCPNTEPQRAKSLLEGEKK